MSDVGTCHPKRVLPPGNGDPTSSDHADDSNSKKTGTRPGLEASRIDLYYRLDLREGFDGGVKVHFDLWGLDRDDQAVA